jgi:outer membrane protein OmpA-like peptidoglycan-associated protein
MPKRFFYIILILAVTQSIFCAAQPAAGGTYEFKAGSKVIFSDDFSQDAIGAFPSKWRMSPCLKKNVPGYPENPQSCSVQKDSNDHVMAVGTSPKIVEPNMIENVYLPDNFAVDFDFTFDTLGRCMEIFFYTSDSKDSCDKTVLHLHYMGTLSVVGSAEQNIMTVKYPNFNASVWHHIAFAYKQKAIDIYLDKYRVASIPDGKFIPYRLGLGCIPPVRYKHFRVTSESGVAYSSEAIAANSARDKGRNKGAGNNTGVNNTSKDKTSDGKENTTVAGGTTGTTNTGGSIASKDNTTGGGISSTNNGNKTANTGGGIAGTNTSLNTGTNAGTNVGGKIGNTGGSIASTTPGSSTLPGNATTNTGSKTTGSTTTGASTRDKGSVTQILTDKKFVTHDILFDVAQSTITPESFSAVEDLAQFLKANPSIKLEIGGHTDNAGDPKVNMKLSQDRADEVKKQLVSMGIDPARLTSKGFGSSKPLQSNNTAEGRANNRRVEFIKL